jgi:putative heme transporter
MRRRLSFRGWLTIITLVLLGVVVVAAWPEIREAWGLLGTVNLWILALLIPVQFFSYFATGEMIFTYLRAKGELKGMKPWSMARTALELNFVNHILPSGGAAGFSYLAWVLNRYGVSAGRSTMAQLIRFTLTFLSFVLLLMVAVAWLILDHQIDRLMILLCSGLFVLAVGATIFTVYIISSKSRLERFSDWLTRKVNRVVRIFTRGRKRKLLRAEVLQKFFGDLHDDYVAIRREKRILIKPFIWATLANIADVALIWIAFWALGYMVSPATLFVAFGLSSIASAFSVTPGGAGVYEAIMIAFLATSGVPADAAIAGTLLARVTLVVGTIAFGYAFYQLTVIKYGKNPIQR